MAGGTPHDIGDVVFKLWPLKKNDIIEVLKEPGLEGLAEPVPLVIGEGKWDEVVEGALEHLERGEIADIGCLRDEVPLGGELIADTKPEHVLCDVLCQVSFSSGVSFLTKLPAAPLSLATVHSIHAQGTHKERQAQRTHIG